MNKTVPKVIFAIALVSVVGGIGQINDDLSTRTAPCNTMFSADIKSGEVCLKGALDRHNEAVNRGWGITIVGSIVAVISGLALIPDSNNTNSQSKKH